MFPDKDVELFVGGVPGHASCVCVQACLCVLCMGTLWD